METQKFPKAARAALAAFIKKTRQKAGLTQKQYCKKLLISERHLQRIENDYCEPSALTLAFFMLTLSEEEQQELRATLKEAFESENTENT